MKTFLLAFNIVSSFDWALQVNFGAPAALFS